MNKKLFVVPLLYWQLVFVLTNAALASSVQANLNTNIIEVEYKTFYSHLRKLDSQDTNALQFAFGFMNIDTNRLCSIESARISTEKQQIPLSVNAENRFTLPTDKVLRLAKAIVIAQVKEPSDKCEVSVQLETKPEYVKTTYTETELDLIYTQYQAFFNEMGSFMSFMMPQVDGLNIQFENAGITTTLPRGLRISRGLLSLNKAQFKQLDKIKLPEKPLRIVPKTSK